MLYCYLLFVFQDENNERAVNTIRVLLYTRDSVFRVSESVLISRN